MQSGAARLAQAVDRGAWGRRSSYRRPSRLRIHYAPDAVGLQPSFATGSAIARAAAQDCHLAQAATGMERSCETL